MSSLMDRGMDFLNRSLQAAGGVTVTYARGVTTARVPVVVGRTVFARNGVSGAAIEFGERDYIIAREDLVLGGVAVEPREGDRLTEVIGGLTVVFEVVPPLGEPAWRWSDPTRTAYRIHVKEVG